MSPIAKQQERPLSLPEYSLKASNSSRFKEGPKALQVLRFGFFGEVGGLLSSVKKAERDRRTRRARLPLRNSEMHFGIW